METYDDYLERMREDSFREAMLQDERSMEEPPDDGDPGIPDHGAEPDSPEANLSRELLDQWTEDRWPREDLVAAQERHELWLGTPAADHLFENGRGE